MNDNATDDGGLQHETAEERRLNRGFITVFEQTETTEYHDEGDRYFSQGFEEARYQFDEDEGDFYLVAVPIAIVELPKPMGEDEYEQLIESQLGKLALSPFFPEMDIVEQGIVTEHGAELMDEVSADE